MRTQRKKKTQGDKDQYQKYRLWSKSYPQMSSSPTSSVSHRNYTKPLKAKTHMNQIQRNREIN